MTIRQRIEENEKTSLCRYAKLSADTAGRVRAEPEEQEPVRTEFQRDRDRIIHCKAFRRLKHKTQVFLSPEGDHYRTRLTHTLEVTQVARTIARALRLNEDLAEAIALGHDLGHTPFGHAGEYMLAEICPVGFTHNAQSLRVVDVLENDGEGLNLTREVRDGILCHTGEKWADTLEGRAVRYADRIAYINHDIDDAERAGILREQDIPERLRKILGGNKSARIERMVLSIIRESENTPDIRPDRETGEAIEELHDFMFCNIYVHPVAKSEEKKAKIMLRQLYEYFMANPDELPDDFKAYLNDTPPARTVCDYIAGMSDRYAVELFRKLFIPESWQGM